MRLAHLNPSAPTSRQPHGVRETCQVRGLSDRDRKFDSQPLERNSPVVDGAATLARFDRQLSRSVNELHAGLNFIAALSAGTGSSHASDFALRNEFIERFLGRMHGSFWLDVEQFELKRVSESRPGTFGQFACTCWAEHVLCRRFAGMFPFDRLVPSNTFFEESQ